MAPERFLGKPGPYPPVGGSLKESDVYSLAMTSFSVCTFFGKPSYYLKQSSRCDQVLTGEFPYDGDRDGAPAKICAGERPSRPARPNQDLWLQDPVWDVTMIGWSHERGPTHLSQNQWLEDPVWDVITTGWSREPKKRCEISVMHDTFVTASQQGIYPGDLNNQDNRNLMITKTSQKPKQGDSNMAKSFHQPPLRSSFCKSQSQSGSRGRLTK